MKKTLLNLAVLASIATGIVSCKGKDGAPGPAGATGAQGPSGTNGTNGTNGNANVVGSNTVTTSTWDVVSANSIYSKTLTLPAITQSIVDKGSVLVYQQSGSVWIPLPYTVGKNVTYCSFSPGLVTLVNYNTDFSNCPNPGAVTYRIVVIAASN